MNSEVKNEGLEVVAVYDGKYLLQLMYMDTDEELCRHSEALAGYAVRDARIAELARYKRFESLYAESEREAIQLRAELASSDLALCESRANDLESTRQLDVAKAELAAIKAQEPAARLPACSSRNFAVANLRDLAQSVLQHDPDVGIFRDEDQAFLINELADLAESFTGDVTLYAAPVAKQVVMPDVTAAAKALCKHHAELCNVNADDQWNVYSQDFIAGAEIVLANSRLNAADQEGGQ